jgi:hypothetical protein
MQYLSGISFLVHWRRTLAACSAVRLLLLPPVAKNVLPAPYGLPARFRAVSCVRDNASLSMTLDLTEGHHDLGTTEAISDSEMGIPISPAVWRG